MEGEKLNNTYSILGDILSRKGSCNAWGVAKIEIRDLTTRLFYLRFF